MFWLWYLYSYNEILIIIGDEKNHNYKEPDFKPY